jgi:hypothetical protein
MSEQAPLFPVYKVMVSFPMRVVDNFASYTDDSATAKKLLDCAKAFMSREDKEDYIRKNITFEFLDDEETPTDEELDDSVLMSADYLEFLKTMMDNGLMPLPPGYTPNSTPKKNKKKKK